jgi:hypothetical protein
LLLFGVCGGASALHFTAPEKAMLPMSDIFYRPVKQSSATGAKQQDMHFKKLLADVNFGCVLKLL